jgi:dolichol-phosphate mannosyltransferase
LKLRTQGAPPPAVAPPPRVPSAWASNRSTWSRRRNGGSVPPELTIVVPTRNEAGNVGPLIRRIDAALLGMTIEVLFVDDSDDGTAARVAAIGDRAGRKIRIIHRSPAERTGGLAGAVVVGMRSARAQWVCVMDADLQHPPWTIPRLLARAREGQYDLVVASRFCEAGSVGTFCAARRALSRASSVTARAAFPRRLRGVSDPMSGFFLVRRAAVDLDALRPRGFKILLEILGRVPGLRVAEVPFTFGDRHAGETKASLRQGAQFLAQLAEMRVGCLGARIGRFGIVGATGLVVNTALLALIAGRGGVHYVLAAIIATQGSTLWNFVLSERWVFSHDRGRRTFASRMAMYFAVNNAANALRVPVLVLLTSGIGINYLVSNLITLLVLFAGRFSLADRWIWSAGERRAPAQGWNYDIHGIVTVCSDGRLPELERFRIGDQIDDPTIRVRLGRVRAARPDPKTAIEPVIYREVHARGFAIRLDLGERTEILASSLLRHSPHVLYTNVVEPVLRWTFVRCGYALVHGACLSVNGQGFLITAKTDTGKTTTILKTLDAHPHAFLSDDLTIVCPDGRVLTYPKPLTISRHTLHAVRTPLLGRRERLALIVQSRLHSRSGRLFGLLLAKTHLPAATMNALVQWIVPPPKFQIDRLIPDVTVAREARLAGMAVIQRGGVGEQPLGPEEALETLMANCEDAYGFPPYPVIAPFLHSRGTVDLRATEREIVGRALVSAPAMLLRSETMDWCERLGGLFTGAAAGNGSRPSSVAGSHAANGNEHDGAGRADPKGNGAVRPVPRRDRSVPRETQRASGRPAPSVTHR